jgi:hypothetical protein
MQNTSARVEYKNKTWNEKLQEVAIRILISKSYQHQPASLRSLKNCLRISAEIHCEDRNVKFWTFFLLIFFFLSLYIGWVFFAESGTSSKQFGLVQNQIGLNFHMFHFLGFFIMHDFPLQFWTFLMTLSNFREESERIIRTRNSVDWFNAKFEFEASPRW